MKAILTVIGQDKVGIVANVSHKLMEMDVNILDISQTIMGDKFTMMMMIDLEKSDLSFTEIKNSLGELGEEIGVIIHMNREEIFNAMHKL